MNWKMSPLYIHCKFVWKINDDLSWLAMAHSPIHSARKIVAPSEQHRKGLKMGQLGPATLTADVRNESMTQLKDQYQIFRCCCSAPAFPFIRAERDHSIPTNPQPCACLMIPRGFHAENWRDFYEGRTSKKLSFIDLLHPPLYPNLNLSHWFSQQDYSWSRTHFKMRKSIGPFHARKIDIIEALTM